MTAPLKDMNPYDTGIPTTIGNAIDKSKEALKALNYEIYNNPELGYNEYKAHDAIVALLEKMGFEVTPHAYGIATSFEAEYGSGGRVVVFNAEYDALPEIGHACGHNLIAITSFASFLAVAAQIKASNLQGRVRLLGTPAEESEGGKIVLIDKGAYKFVDACLMAHPGPLFAGYSKEYTGIVYQPHVATEAFKVSFKGKTAHAGFAPWQGTNALDAIVLGYNGISMLRQQIQPTERIHGIIVDGGLTPNVIPGHGSVEYCVGARSLADNKRLKQRVVNCFLGASTATGCEVEVTDGSLYADLRPNKFLCILYTEIMAKLNSPVFCDVNTTEVIGGSTDQGNVSYVVPAIHPIYGIPVGPGNSNHTIGFATAAGTEEAFDRSLVVAKGLAITAWSILADDAVANKMKKEFDEEKKDRA
ncbi:MAG: hypothetical protein M1834_008938 [Cirrosporium novae-zelandiae]|nr:MAG: hypothetical protein M1834_008938 [Cirrosporium novae-zelandiae]